MTTPGPGKFEGNESLEVAEALYEICGNGAMDDSFGDNSSGLGWYALLTSSFAEGNSPLTKAAYIVEEDTSGFFTVIDEFDDIEKAKAAFEELREKFDVTEAV